MTKTKKGGRIRYANEGDTVRENKVTSGARKKSTLKAKKYLRKFLKKVSKKY